MCQPKYIFAGGVVQGGGKKVQKCVKKLAFKQDLVAQRVRGAKWTNKIEQLFTSNPCATASLREIVDFFTASRYPFHLRGEAVGFRDGQSAAGGEGRGLAMASAHVRRHGKEEQKQPLSPWPIRKPDGYRRWLNRSQLKPERTKHDLCATGSALVTRSGAPPWGPSGRRVVPAGGSPRPRPRPAAPPRRQA